MRMVTMFGHDISLLARGPGCHHPMIWGRWFAAESMYTTVLLGLLHDFISHWSPGSLGENATTLWPWGHLWSRVCWIPEMQLSWSYCHETNKPWSKLHAMKNIKKKRVWIHLSPTLIIWPIVETPILSWLVVLTCFNHLEKYEFVNGKD